MSLLFESDDIFVQTLLHEHVYLPLVNLILTYAHEQADTIVILLKMISEGLRICDDFYYCQLTQKPYAYLLNGPVIINVDIRPLFGQTSNQLQVTAVDLCKFAICGAGSFVAFLNATNISKTVLILDKCYLDHENDVMLAKIRSQIRCTYWLYIGALQ